MIAHIDNIAGETGAYEKYPMKIFRTLEDGQENTEPLQFDVFQF